MTAPPMARLAAFRRRHGRMVDRGLRLGFVAALVVFAVVRPIPAVDAHAYWAVDLADPYSRPIATADAFTYPPPAALAFAVLGRLPWEVFQAVWTLLIGAALLWLAGPWSFLFLALPIVASDLYLGNIHVLLAAAVVGSLRRPGLWSIALLTKPTCGLAVLWYAVRGEWRRLAEAIGVAGALAALSAVLAPDLWPKWIDYLLATGVAPDVGTAFWVPIPLLARLPAAALLVAWGARTDRAWTLPTATMLALPVLWMVGLAMLAGAFAVSPWGPLRGFAERAIAVRTPAAGALADGGRRP